VNEPGDAADKKNSDTAKDKDRRSSRGAPRSATPNINADRVAAGKRNDGGCLWQSMNENRVKARG
jgi:hypothetical protein